MASIESYVQPRRLYRYRSVDKLDRELDALKTRYLYCSPYMKLNDPMEGLFTSSSLLRKSSQYRAIKKAIIDNKERLGMCSFSEVSDHELMWAHYAKQFTGICISYSLSRLLKTLGDDLSFVRMYYDEMVPTVHRTRKDPNQLAKMVLSYKNYRWLHEREWRLFAPQGKIYYQDTECVTRVYLGSRISPANRLKIERTLKGLSITTCAMTIDEYFISFENPGSV